MKKEKSKIYVAGPYSIGNKELNVFKAIVMAEKLVRLNYVPYVPHLNHFWDGSFKHPPKFWYAYDIFWLKCCDYIVRIPGKSKGADNEMRLAKKWGIPTLIIK